MMLVVLGRDPRGEVSSTRWTLGARTQPGEALRWNLRGAALALNARCAAAVDGLLPRLNKCAVGLNARCAAAVDGLLPRLNKCAVGRLADLLDAIHEGTEVLVSSVPTSDEKEPV